MSEFIKSHRDGWYRNSKELRDQIEHRGFKLPQIKHRIRSDGKVVILFPRIGKQSIEEMLEVAWINLSGLCEEVLVFIMSLELKEPYVIWRIPEEKRAEHNWKRYKIAHQDYPEAHISTS